MLKYCLKTTFNYWQYDLYQKEMKIAVENGYIQF
jgi:hypothetical protein